MTNGQSIPTRIPTMGEIFRAGSHKTAYAGKWHLPKSFDGMTAFEKIAGEAPQKKKWTPPWPMLASSN